MEIDLGLTEEELAALRARAEKEGRSMEDVARQAIYEYVSDRPQSLTSAVERVRSEDAELLERLSD